MKDITAKSEKGYDGEYRFHAIDGYNYYILQDFFQAGAEEAAAIIQNRVQLYLNERK